MDADERQVLRRLIDRETRRRLPQGSVGKRGCRRCGAPMNEPDPDCPTCRNRSAGAGRAHNADMFISRRGGGFVGDTERKAPTPQTPDRVPASIGLLADEFDPGFGSYGETIVSAPSPGIAFGPPLEPEDPPWKGQPAVGPLPAQSAPDQRPAHLVAYDPPPPGPVDTSFVPMQRPVPPRPDWRLEERLRAARDAKPEAVEEQPAKYPPPRRQST